MKKLICAPMQHAPPQSQFAATFAAPKTREPEGSRLQMKRHDAGA